jgi:hypothetical protein
VEMPRITDAKKTDAGKNESITPQKAA